ncbi:MAG: thiamine-phosphate kinase [Bacteroidales bacterium]
MTKKSIKELGEFGLIDHLTSDIKTTNESSIYGIGDDAAILDHGGRETVVTSDILMEGIHFDLVYTPLKHLGYKSIIVNLSDIYAMNGKPEQVIVSIAISSKFSLQALDDLYAGMKEACRIHHVDIVGGDTTSSLTGVAISITAIGSVEKGKAVKRSTAKNKELICVSGDLGAAYLGLQLLEREKKIFMKDPRIQPKLNQYPYVLERQLKPEARKDVTGLLADNGITPSAMIDISDGLSSDILHIAKQSGLGCRLYEDKIPIGIETRKVAEEFNMDPGIAALNGGEDYELLFTVPLSEHEKIPSIPGISIIGHMVPESQGYMLVARNGNEIPLQAQGWNPLSGEEKTEN